MKRLLILSAILAFAIPATASWYWPFGGKKDKAPRLSELMEPASRAYDRAMDFAADGKIDEAVEQYRVALREIDRIEAENPDRAKTQEFISVRNKRAMASTAIDSLLLKQARENAKPVAVTDTTELERKLAAERKRKADAAEAAKKMPRETRIDRILALIAGKDHSAAEAHINRLLDDNPRDAAALNLLASCQLAKGELAAAEATLALAIERLPESPFAHYNLARLKLKLSPPDKEAARAAYAAGRKAGGGVDTFLEEALK